MNPNNNANFISVKSSIVAGLLGIFLGSFGAHNWYLGQKKQGILHLALWGGSLVLMLFSAVFVSLATIAHISILAGFFGFILALAYIALFANGVWGLIEGITLLVQGDAGLAAKGYTVAVPYTPNSATNSASAAEATIVTPAPEAKSEAKSEAKTAKAKTAAKPAAEPKANK